VEKRMIVQVNNLCKDFKIERGIFKKEIGVVRAVDNITFAINEFTTTGIIGESGCGKTTLAKMLVKLINPTSGEIIYNPDIIIKFRKDVQLIFQNPYNSLSPRMPVIELLSEPLRIHSMLPAKHFKGKIINLLEAVGLDDKALMRLPKEFSGGQRQRICIARALAAEPKILVLDEPISSLDLTIQMKLLDLFKEIKDKLKLTLVFISHNLSVIKYMADSVIIMRAGKIIEHGQINQIFNSPKNSYTQHLLSTAVEKI
jgi:ABC-type glutathione transport system ATPase component